MRGRSSYALHCLLSFARTVKEGVRKRAAGRLYGDWTSIGLRRDLTEHLTPPSAKIPIRVRLFEPRDIASLFTLPEGASDADRYEVEYRRAILAEEFAPCFVAETEEGIACYMQWLLSSHENERIRRFFNRRFPPLTSQELLLEGAYVPPRFRGLRIMPAAMARVAEMGHEMGGSSVITFVEYDNIPSLKGCQRAGFVPYLVRRDRWVLTPKLRSLRFVPLSAYLRTPNDGPSLPEWLAGAHA